MFRLENLDRLNRHRITVTGKTNHGLNVTAVQTVFCNANEVIPRSVHIPDGKNLRHRCITDLMQFKIGLYQRTKTWI